MPMSVPSSPSSYHASDGAAYERFLGRWTGRLAPLLVDVARLPDDGDVLDVGCGTGSLALEVARRGPDRAVAGVDLSEPYVAFARTRRDTLNVNFKRCDAAELPFTGGQFAAVLAQLVLTFVADANKVVAQMVRVTRGEAWWLRPSGISAGGSSTSGFLGHGCRDRPIGRVRRGTDCLHPLESAGCLAGTLDRRRSGRD